MLCFSRPNSKDVTNLGTLSQSRECQDVKKLYRYNGRNIIHHGTSTNQLEKLFQTHFWVILVTFNDVPPIQLTPPQNTCSGTVQILRESKHGTCDKTYIFCFWELELGIQVTFQILLGLALTKLSQHYMVNYCKSQVCDDPYSRSPWAKPYNCLRN